MPTHYTTETWIEKARAVHGDKYDYSRVNYVNWKTKVTIICLSCGEVFEQNPNNHVNFGKGCRSCFVKRITKTTEDFIRAAIVTHGSAYDYSMAVYTGARSKVEITCNKCGLVFSQEASSHVRGCGCPACITRITNDEFISRCIESHNIGEYDYGKTVFRGVSLDITVYCNRCNRYFEQNAGSHLAGCGCPNCYKSRKHTTHEYIAKAENKYPNLYDFSKTIYSDASNKVVVGCQKCGASFEIIPRELLRGHGCPDCSMPIGEKNIATILDRLGIEYERQKKFDGCKHKRKLPFDFYLPKHNICIEHQGEQHRKVIDFFGGKKAFEQLKKRDAIKRIYCKKNGIDLVEIPDTMTFNEIETLLCKLAIIQLSLF